MCQTPKIISTRTSCDALGWASALEGRQSQDHARQNRSVTTAAAYRWKVVWPHDATDDPVVLSHELDGERCELRKVEVYADGRMDRADADSRTGSTRLSDQSLRMSTRAQACLIGGLTLTSRLTV